MLEKLISRKFVSTEEFGVKLEYGLINDKKGYNNPKPTIMEEIYDKQGKRLHTIITTDSKIDKSYLNERACYYKNNYCL